MVKSRILIFFLIILVSRISSQTTTAITQVSTDESQREILLSSDKINLSQNNLACTVTATNDNFANAQTLIVNGGTVSGTTCGSLEPGETQGCNNGTESVWYKFTATLASQFVQITQTSGGCYYGSAVYSITALPTSTCNNTDLISCQALNTGPITQLYQLTSLSIGTTYYIQIIYVSGGSCGSNATFNIGVTTANPGAFITNPPPINSCSNPQPSCFFPSPPSINTVTSTCAAYPLSTSGYSANSVMTIFQTFTNSPTSSNISIAGLFTSNCSGGNVVWLKWWLYDCSCNFVSCGDITSLNVGGLTCGGCYNIKYQFELANCSTFTNFYPYQNVPFTPVICTGLPNMLDLEENAIVIKNTSEGKVFLSFDLKSNFEFDLSLYDVLGRKVKSENLFIEEGQSNREIETSSLKESYYMLIIKDTKSNFQKTQKVRISNN